MIQRSLSDLFLSPPNDVKKLARRKGTLQPAGATIYAEGDTRNFHEILFILHNAILSTKKVSKDMDKLIRYIFDYYATRFRGWYGLGKLADQIKIIQKDLNFSKKKDCLNKLEFLMTYVGRINFWIDLIIPWYSIKEVMEKRKSGKKSKR